MLTWQENYTKTQRLTKSNNSDDLIQIKQDLNTGYHLFNAKLSRYFTRKQQFTDLFTDQMIYQTPVDSVRILGMTISVSSTYQIPVKEIRSEFEWRDIVSYPYSSNWPAFYFVLGNDEIALWPTPSQNVSNGLRYYYQPQDHDLSIDDVTSTSTGQTISITNGLTTVTATGNPFTADMVSLWFQVTGQTDNTWYEIVGATTNTLTLKSAYVGTSASTLAWRVGQAWIIPQEYTDAPMHYSLSNFFSAQGNEARAKFHQDKYDTMVMNCMEDYSSSSEGNVLTELDGTVNMWFAPPVPNP